MKNNNAIMPSAVRPRASRTRQPWPGFKFMMDNQKPNLLGSHSVNALGYEDHEIACQRKLVAVQLYVRRLAPLTMPAPTSKAYQWSDKTSGQMLFDCLLFVSPLILITDCTYNTYRDVAGASLSLVLIFAGLSAWCFWCLSSRRKFKMDTETLIVRRCCLCYTNNQSPEPDTALLGGSLGAKADGVIHATNRRWFGF